MYTYSITITIPISITITITNSSSSSSSSSSICMTLPRWALLAETGRWLSTGGARRPGHHHLINVSDKRYCC